MIYAKEQIVFHHHPGMRKFYMIEKKGLKMGTMILWIGIKQKKPYKIKLKNHHGKYLGNKYTTLPKIKKVESVTYQDLP